MRQISISELTTLSTNFEVNKFDKYLLTYPVFTSYFQNIVEVTDTDIIKGVAFVYSWMQRIISIESTSIKDLTGSSKNKMLTF